MGNTPYIFRLKDSPVEHPVLARDSREARISWLSTQVQDLYRTDVLGGRWNRFTLKLTPTKNCTWNGNKKYPLTIEWECGHFSLIYGAAWWGQWWKSVKNACMFFNLECLINFLCSWNCTDWLNIKTALRKKIFGAPRVVKRGIRLS